MNRRYEQAIVRQVKSNSPTYEWVLNLTSTHVNFNNYKVLNGKNVKQQGLSCPTGGRIMCTTPLENDLGTLN